jgi:hypothetical protein
MIAPLVLSALMLGQIAGDTIRLGDPTLTGILQSGVDTIDAYVVREGQRQLAVTYVETIVETASGYLVIQENRNASGVVLTLDTLAVTRGSLATEWHGDVTPTGRRHVTFAGERMTGVEVDSAGVETSIDERVPAGRFDYSIMSLVTNRLPLAAGYRATLATYDIARGPVDVSFTVGGPETIAVGGASFDTWRIEVDLGPRIVTRWVERGTGRELRWSVSLPGRELIGEPRHP